MNTIAQEDYFKLLIFAEATDFDLLDGGEWLINATKTQDSLEDFVTASKDWNESTSAKFGNIANFQFVAWESAQARKGDTRKSISVIDFGFCRYVLEEDLTDYSEG